MVQSLGNSIFLKLMSCDFDIKDQKFSTKYIIIATWTDGVTNFYY